jgi:lipoyl(octanoyl) transferase
MLVEVQWLGRVAYDDAWQLQKSAVEAFRDGGRRDKLLLLEHPAVYTLGRRAQIENVLMDEQARREAGIALRRVDRGGDVTYHGPGQLVGYPILNLRRLYGARGFARPDLHLYLREIEETVIRTLKQFGIHGWRYEGYTGVWVDGEDGPLKIAAIGIRVNSRGISSHGFALNVDPDLRHFEGIIPCGIVGHGVTSMARQLRRPVTVTDVLEPVQNAFSTVFGVNVWFVRPFQTT